MNTKKLKKLNKSILHATESCRGIDMDAYTAMRSAYFNIKNAIRTLEARQDREIPAPVPLKELFPSAHNHTSKGN